MKMLLKMMGVAALTCMLPLAVYAEIDMGEGALKGSVDLEKAHQNHQKYTFVIFGKEGELKSTGKGACTLTLTGKDVEDVSYQAVAPSRDFGSMKMTEFVNYWAPGQSFAKSGPNAGLVTSNPKNGDIEHKAYVITLTSATYSEDKEKLTFGCMFNGDTQGVKDKVKLKKPILWVDGVGGYGSGV